jgi:hypothetical protein
MKNLLLVILAVLIGLIFVSSVEAQLESSVIESSDIESSVVVNSPEVVSVPVKEHKKHEKCVEEVVCKKVAKRVCKEDKVCKARAAIVCKQTRTKTVKHTCKSIARTVCTSKGCIKKAVNHCKKEGKLLKKVSKRVPNKCRALSFERCTAAEGAKECRRAVVKSCVEKHRVVKHFKKSHKVVVRKQAKKIAHVVCKGKEGKKLERCHKKVVKQVKKHFEKVKKQTKKALKKCACKVLAIKSCTSQENSFDCRKTFISTCHKQCLSTAKIGKNRSFKLAKKLCKANEECIKKVVEHSKKASKHVHKFAKKVFKNTRRNCKTRALVKCEAGVAGKACRKAHVTKCHKKRVVKRNHKKAFKKVVRKHAKEIARVVCEGKHGKQLERCHKRVEKQVKKHLKKVRRHTKKSLSKCECKVKSRSVCGVDATAKQCKKSFVKTCHKECLNKAKTGKNKCSKLAKRVCKKNNAKCHSKVISSCKKAVK